MAALEFTRRYAMAHRLLATKSPKCAIPHGHNEFVTVRLAPLAPFRFTETNSTAPLESCETPLASMDRRARRPRAAFR